MKVSSLLQSPDRIVRGALLLLMAADAVIKRYTAASALSSSALYPYFMWLVFAVLVSSALLLYRYFALRSGEDWNARLNHAPRNGQQTILFLLIVLFAIALRFWKLDSLYDGLWFDEAYKGLDALAIRNFGERPVFLGWNAPREAMVAYLAALSTGIFGDGIFAIRAVQAFAGSLTVVFFFLFVRLLFRTDIALIAAFLLAVSKYHLIYSRLGFRIPLFLLCESATLFFVARAIVAERKQTASFILGGICAALGFYTYIAYRIFPFVLLAFFLDPGIRPRLAARRRGLALGLIAGILVIAPLLFYFYQHPEDFLYRMQSVGIWSEATDSRAQQLLRNVLGTLQMFTFVGDSSTRHNVNAEPALSPFSTSFFWIGGLLTVANIKRPYAFFLIVFFAAGLIPGILSTENPHAGRTIGALLPALIFASVGISAALSILRLILRNRTVHWLLIIILAGNFITGANDAIFRYARAQDAESALAGMNRLEYNVVNYVKTTGTGINAYLSPQLFFHAAVEYLTYPNTRYNLYTLDTKFSAGAVNAVVLVPERRYLWWITDEPGKNFFKWWSQYREMKIGEIHKVLERMYNLPPKRRQSDAPLLVELKRKFPEGKEVNMDHFTVYLFKTN